MDSTTVARREFPGWQLGPSAGDVADLPVLAEVDVVVAGGGAAGVAAATVAAEAGLSVVLVEKYGFCGGAAVAGMSGTICGSYLARRHGGPSERVVDGFTGRFRAELLARGGLTAPLKYGKTYTEAHDPLVWKETADDLLAAAGVRVLLHTSVAGVLLDDDRHRGLVLESSAGRSIVRAARTIDASGDAAVIARAGWGTHFGDNGAIQNPTMMFRVGGVDMVRFAAFWGEDTICPPPVSAAIEQARNAGLELPRSHIWVFPSPRPRELLVNATQLNGPEKRMLNVVDPEDFTYAETAGRKQVRDYAAFLRGHVPGCEEIHVIDVGTEAGIRQTRSITGVGTLTDEDVVTCHKRPDGIVRSPWPIELHEGDRTTLHWLIDDFYEVPYSSLVPQRGENVIVAGRCLSAEHRALASARVTAQCFEYGHAAAVATSISLARNLDYRTIDGALVRKVMRENGSLL